MSNRTGMSMLAALSAFAAIGEAASQNSFVIRPGYGRAGSRASKSYRYNGRRVCTGTDAYGTQYTEMANGQIIRSPKLLGKAREAYRQEILAAQKGGAL